MNGRLLNIGFENFVNQSKIISVSSYKSAPSRRMVQEARDKGMLIDATEGRKTRSVLVVDNYVILSSTQAMTIAKRMNGEDIKDEI